MSSRRESWTLHGYHWVNGRFALGVEKRGVLESEASMQR
jgi:hypothetical protein